MLRKKPGGEERGMEVMWDVPLTSQSLVFLSKCRWFSVSANSRVILCRRDRGDCADRRIPCPSASRARLCTRSWDLCRFHREAENPADGGKTALETCRSHATSTETTSSSKPLSDPAVSSRIPLAHSSGRVTRGARARSSQPNLSPNPNSKTSAAPVLPPFHRSA